MKLSESKEFGLIDDLKKENDSLRRQLEDLKARSNLLLKYPENGEINPGKRTDEKVLENEQRLQAIFDHAAIGIVEMDIEDRFIIVNNRVCEILEYSREELLTKKVTDITAPEDLPKTIELNSRMHRGEFEIFAYEKRYLKRTGLPVWVYVTISAIRDAHGKFLKSIGTIENISERKYAEIKLRESEEMFSTMFRAMPIGIALIALSDGVIYDVNQAWLDLTGYSSKDEVVGKNSRELGLIPDANQFDEIIKEFRNRGSVRNAETWFISKENIRRMVSLNLDMILIKSEKFVFYTITDITEIKQSEAKIQELLGTAERHAAELHAVIESMPDAVYIGTANGITQCNSPGLKMLGASSLQDLNLGIGELGKKFNIRWPVSNLPLSRDELQFTRALKGETVIEEVIGTNISTGEDIYIRAADAPVIVNGEIIGAVAINSDITERKKVENDALVRAIEIEAILSCIADGVVVYDSEGRIVRSNSAAESIIHVSENEKELTLLERVSRGFGVWTEDGRQLNSEEMPAYRATIHAETINNEVLLLKGPSGPRWISVSAAPLFVSGKHTGGVISMSDITERRSALVALRESEEKFRLLFENITEGIALHEIIYEHDKPVNYRLIDSNPAFREYTGIDIYKTQGVLATEIYGTGNIPYLNEYAEVAETRKPYRFETFSPDMNRNFIINVISPKNGQFATVFEDITDQKKTEREIQQKNDELTRFIYTVSHDLKSPLVTIQAFASYLKEDIESGDKEARNKDINYISNAAEKMGKLLDELLELSRIGRKEKAKTEIPLKTVVESAVDLVAGRIDKKKIRINFTGDHIMLYGHAQRFVQLYQNLIDNSAKFIGDQPEPFIEIGSFLNEEKNNEIVLYVRDNGSGIDPRHSHKIFGLFEKLDNNTEGTGIGLALVRRIIEVHGGTIWFDSGGEGKGATFYFTLEGTRIIK
jgi:PAS domain S-box-containing protein